MTRIVITISLCLGNTVLLVAPVEATSTQDRPGHEQRIRILGTSLAYDRTPIGVVADIVIALERRNDHKGLMVSFESTPGHFSPLTQAAALAAIITTAEAAKMNTDSWSVTLSVPYPGITIYGVSLSAMVGLSAVALARGDVIPLDRVITGTVTADGHIGTVGGIPLKLQAAFHEQLHRVLIPEELDIADEDWRTPFLMQVSPVATVSVAYQALTGQPMR
ncbi:MAG: S16 family serine protease [Nitrospiraceae bacterium]